MYRQVGIYVILVGIEIWTEANYISLSADSLIILKSFLDYRKKHILGKFKHDNAQLIMYKYIIYIYIYAMFMFVECIFSHFISKHRIMANIEKNKNKFIHS